MDAMCILYTIFLYTGYSYLGRLETLAQHGLVHDKSMI